MNVDDVIGGSPYLAYLYAYPHKWAYRAIDPPVPLDEVWAAERKDALSLYLHLPFCEMRCGFCNLFTTPRPAEDLVDTYLATLARQAHVVKDALGVGTFARMAVGGGTPTFLSAGQLAGLFDVVEELGVDPREIPVSIETSPETATAERLRLLAARGVDRVSIGVQSFFDDECAAVNRPQRQSEALGALDAIRSAGFAMVNVDLMYGLPGQDRARWLASIDEALRFRPEELYLYPLYVRPLTALGRSERRWDDERLALYRAGRDHLLARGYQQVSMRMFRAAGAPAPANDGPVYCCQTDGMVGLGCGARSYSRGLHFGTPYAVGARGVKEILGAWIARDDADFARADFGFRLDDDEQRRRHAILSLLQAEGLDLAAYRARFATDALSDLPDIGGLVANGLAARAGDVVRLTAAGVERSDAIGPLLVSPRVETLMAGADRR